jgi:hypothetical protein
LDETLVNHFGNIRCISDQASWVDYNDDHIDCFDADGVILADSADLIIFDDSKLLQAIEKVEKDAELLEQEKQATIDEMFSFLVDSLKETCESIVEEANEKIEYKINTRDGHHHQISFDGDGGLYLSYKFRMKDHKYVSGAGKLYGFEAPDFEVVYTDDMDETREAIQDELECFKEKVEKDLADA